jgi:hypothetical protein
MPCRTSAALLGFAVIAIQAIAGPVHAAPWRADEDNTRGWMLMTPQERIEHQARVRGFTSYEACQAYRAEHHAVIEQRARERGLAAPGEHWDFCDRLKRGAPRD